MNLIIDEGNTRIKLAVFKDSQLVDIKITSFDLCSEEIQKLQIKYNLKAVVLSSVTDKFLDIFKELEFSIKLNLSNSTWLPFTNSYKTPKTLGVDRLALTTAAFFKYPKQNSLIIDVGSCITYDFINSKGVYLGGGIAPGLQMKFKAMHHFTEKLPLVDITTFNHKLIGDTTTNALLSGVVNGTVFEIDGFINKYDEVYPNLNVILTGGDANFLCKKLKNSIFVNPNFLLEGLNYILTCQP